ncbi:acyl-CoA dehydrogenase family protein [Nocardia gipuzkoensis]|uniref:acyl-CoA dehydrogenase family protein n=1 Tax=Nocardia gipuzkoensis TaxID=2749991 RepID=UPI00237D55BF|nr:acyl-CoA dehydrogenase family protein [Nocardia gipuzkoensis]MDE1672635.1 acyl-CoA dehydrogenase family protein [Nocardia gipuzkoensis]
MPGRSYSDTAHHGYELMAQVVAALGGSATDIARNFPLLCAIYDSAAIHAPRLLTVLHSFNLGLAPIVRLGTGAEYQRSCLRALEDGTASGAFAGTELGHGTNLLGVQTQAIWQPQQRRFLLHTPAPEAIKFMPNIADAAVSKIGIVLARLFVAGADEGVWPFLVVLRDAQGQLTDGIELTALPPSVGGPAMDHAGFRFIEKPIPAQALLCGQLAHFDDAGRFRCALSRNQRFHTSIGTIDSGRALYAGAALASARAGWSITTRYARQRLTAGGVLLGDRDGIQRDLISSAARITAATALTSLTRARFTTGNDGQPDPTAAPMAMLAKPLATYTARDVLTTCRENVGAQGISGMNYLGDYIERVTGMITAEGANSALLVAAGRSVELAAAGRLPRYMDISQLRVLDEREPLPWWNAMLHEREEAIVTAAREGALTGVSAIGADSAATEVAIAVTDRLAADAVIACATAANDSEAETVLRDLGAVFALERINTHSDWFAAHRQLPAKRASEIQRQLTTRYSALVPQLHTTLLDAFAVGRLPALIDQPDYIAAWSEYLGWGAEDFTDLAANRPS